MAKTIKQVFEDNCERVKVDRRFIQTVRDMRTAFVNRNEDHLAFFSGNLLGVHPIRFRTIERQRWFDEILEVDESDLKEDIKDVDYLDPDWVRANDAMNLSCIWLLHRIQNSTSLSARDKEKALTDVLLILQYKFLSSIMAHYFPYPADRAVAVATYEALSRKFEIKQHGSWQELLEHRCRMILSKDSIHYTTYDKMRDDQAVVYMVNDVQQRLREIVKKYRAIFQRVKDQNLRIQSSSTVIVLDGQAELIERTRDHTDYTRYMKDVITDKPTFIREELVDVVADAMHTMNEAHLYQALEYCSNNYGRGGDRNIEPLIEQTLLHAYQYLSDNQGVMASPSDLAGLIGKLKNLYAASRMSDPQLIGMRDLADKLVKRSVSSRNSAALASVRTGLQIYIVLRAFARKYYQG